MALLELKNINKFYKQDEKKFYALKNINIKINNGEMIAIMGPSGAGKTTLLNIIGGIDFPTEGEYLINNLPINKFTDKELSKIRNITFGFIFQYFALLKDYTAMENVQLPLNYRKTSRSDKEEKAMKYLKYVGLYEHRNKLPKKMSGGQQQRIAIARALAQETNVILADEPTGALDQNTSKEIMNVLKEINANGKTILIVTHDDKTASFCNRKIFIQDGEILHDCSN